jgi:DNA-binding Xre family transcriptional regulator
MRLRVPDLLAQRDMTAYELAKLSTGRLSVSTAYRLSRGEWKCLSGDQMDALCDVLNVEPGDLLEREMKKRKKNA